jgi:hypothetical protein
MTRLWSRRSVLPLSVCGITALAGCSVMGSRREPMTQFYGGRSVAYQHERVRLSLSQKTIQVGASFEFTVANTSESSITLGCHNPWTLQKYRDGQWRDVVWTSANGKPACATVLDAGKTRTERVTLERSALETQTETVREDLTSGRYRVVLLSTDPFLAADFQVE